MSSNALATIGAALLLIPAVAMQAETTQPHSDSAASPVAVRPVPDQRPVTPGVTFPTGGAEPGPASPVAPEEDLAASFREALPAPARGAPSRDGPPPDAGPGGWTWPLAPRPTVVRRFDVGPFRWSRGHRGVDLDAAPADAVIAPAGGVVTFARIVVGRPVVVITHAGGVRTSYEPVRAAVPVGAVVRRGDVIGHVMSAGNHCGAAVCLHWGARRGGDYIDPLTLLGRPRIVLLPLRPP